MVRVPKKEKKTSRPFRASFYKQNLHETNLSKKSSIVQNKIIHVMVATFQMCTYICMNILQKCKKCPNGFLKPIKHFFT